MGRDHGESDAVDEPEQHRLAEEVGDKAEPERAGEEEHDAHLHGERCGERRVEHRVDHASAVASGAIVTAVSAASVASGPITCWRDVASSP